MKKIITVLVILCLMFTLGCAAKPAPRSGVPADKTTGEPVDTPAEVAADDATADTAAAVTDIEAELDDLEDLDEDFLSEELESLDSELDFEI